MKKLIVATAIVLGSFIGNASPILNPCNVAQTINVQEEYIEVKQDEVPVVVKEELKKAYPNASLDKAFINSNKEYKLEITLDGKKGNLFADANGNWIQK